jgi:hypothetical protein
VTEEKPAEVSPCKVLVIDDLDQEASDLIRALSARDIPVLYYSGNVNELPKNPVTGVRIVFLDMKLAGMEKQEDETIASSLMQLLKTIISKANGPYLIFAWTKHAELLRVFREQLQSRGTDVPKPFFLLDMEKTACMSGDSLDYTKVSSQLGEKLHGWPILKFLTTWERTVAESTYEVTGLVNSMVESTDVETWNAELGKILYQIAKAELGPVLKDTPEAIDNSAMKALDSLLSDCIENRVDMISEKLLKCPANVEIGDDVKAKINTRINLRDLQNPETCVRPGNLYVLRDFAHLGEFFDYLPNSVDDFKKESLTSIEGQDNIRLCMMEITPTCDHACKKWKASRLLAGFLLPSALEKRVKDADFVYKTPLFFLEGGLYHIVLNLYYTVSLKFGSLNGLAPRYQVRTDLLSDIQSKFSSHISRRGVVKL